MKLDKTLTVIIYFLLLLVAVASCSRYSLGEEGEVPPPPPPESDKLIWYVASYGDDAAEGYYVDEPLRTVQTALDRIFETVINGWPENTWAEIVVLDNMGSLGNGEPVGKIKKEEALPGQPEEPDYPVIRFRGPNIPVDGVGGTGTLRSDKEHYVLHIENNTNDVLLGDGLTLTEGKGGVYVSEAKFIIESGATIEGNEAADGSGGGVYVGPYGTLTMKGGIIRRNTASSSGGGVYVASHGVFTMTSGSISENTAFFGGGVAVGAGGSTAAEFVMNGVTATVNNNVAIFAGGGVYVGAGNEVLFDKSNGTLASNSAHTGESNYGHTVAVGSTNINSPNQIANFKDNASPVSNKLFAQYILTANPAESGWFYNATDNNWR